MKFFVFYVFIYVFKVNEIKFSNFNVFYGYINLTTAL